MAKCDLRAAFLVTVAVFAVLVRGIDDKCAACNAIAEELQLGLLREKPRNHLDMRHRLDSKGQRQGKLINYRVSELRVVELLDGLCEKMQDYTLEKAESGSEAWIKVKDWDQLELNTSKQEARAHAKYISTFCGRLLEETEDELTEAIKNGSFKTGQVSKVLCQDLTGYCGQTSGKREEMDDEDTSKEEL